jgi:lipoate-protein ligase A
MKWRLLLTGHNDAATNMSIDESIMVFVGQGEAPPTIRLYGWSPPAVSIGYFQGLEEEVDLLMCEKYGIDYIRRITGGGAVFHEHEVTYSLSIPESSLLIPSNVLESYKVICQGIVKGLAELDVKSEFAPLNDILIDGKKISGSAQTRRSRTILQHGTVLIDTDVDKMFSILKVPSEKIKDKLISDVKQRVTSLKSTLAREVDFKEVCDALSKGFECALDIELEEGKLSNSELALSQDIKKDRYSSSEWNHRR